VFESSFLIFSLIVLGCFVVFLANPFDDIHDHVYEFYAYREYIHRLTLVLLTKREKLKEWVLSENQTTTITPIPLYPPFSACRVAWHVRRRLTMAVLWGIDQQLTALQISICQF